MENINFLRLLSVILIITIIAVLMLVKSKQDSEINKDWSSYIISQIGSDTRPLFKKVMKDYFYKKNQNNNFQYRAANFGSGSGREDIELIDNGWEVLSIDSCSASFEVIEKKTLNSIGKSSFFHGDFASVKLTKKYDLIMSFYSLPFGSKKDLDKILRNINNHIKLEGIFVANFFGEGHDFVKNKRAYGISQKELLIKLLKNNFEIKEFKSNVYYTDAFSSEGQKIKWEVLEVIAKKHK